MPKLVRAGRAIDEFELVLFEKIEYRDLALVLDFAAPCCRWKLSSRSTSMSRDGVGGCAVLVMHGGLSRSLKADCHGMAMTVQPFGFRQRHCRRAERRKALALSFRIDVRFMKSSTPSPEENRAGAGRRQHVVRSSGIIAHGFRRVMADENRARIADRGDHLLRGGAGTVPDAPARAR